MSPKTAPRSQKRKPASVASGRTPSTARRSGAKNRSLECDGYIAKAPPFAKPILKRLRRLFHSACPGINEALKWGHPAFEHHGIVGGMAAFKEHVRLGFWKGRLLRDPKNLLRGADGNAAGVLIVRDAAELPPDEALLDYIRQAVELNVAGAKVPRPAPSSKAVPLTVPDDLSTALRGSKRAQAGFDALSTTHRNEYVEWLVSAKQAATRRRRLLTTVNWLSEGKPRHWKYMKAW
jgi:uncharacterized protein YdeI (YjbR/CyaY-like superfamily)